MTKKRRVLVFFIMASMMLAVGAEAALVNPGFEDDFTGWTSYGSTAVVSIVTMGDGSGGTTEFSPCAGNNMASITYPAMTGHVTDNYIVQDVVLGPDNNYLNFKFNFWTYDEAPFDNPGFRVEINGETWVSMEAGDIGDGTVGTLNYTDWIGLSIPVSGYYVDEERPAEIRLSFSVGNTGDSQYPSGAFVDATSLTSDAEYQVVPIPAAVLLLGSGLVGVLALGKTRRKSGITGQ